MVLVSPQPHRGQRRNNAQLEHLLAEVATKVGHSHENCGHFSGSNDDSVMPVRPNRSLNSSISAIWNDPRARREKIAVGT